jgi:hypothetical protein
MELDPDSVPSTVEAAVEATVAAMEEEDIEAIKTATATPTSVHHFVGRALRNSWSLWEDNPMKRDAVFKYRIAHGDDMSSLILHWTWAKIRGEEFDPVKGYKGPMPEDK